MTCRPATLLLFFVISAAAGDSQQIDLGSGVSSAGNRRQHVEVVSDKLQLHANHPQDIEVIFRVDPGFHINSHQPKDGLLIPTTFALEKAPDMNVLSEEYPKGTPFTISLGSESEVLDVYSGEFRVAFRVTVHRGASTLHGVLHYQACDNAACFPPRDLPITLAISAN